MTIHGSDRRRLAQRLADAHRGIDDSSLLAFVSGSVVDGLADARSDVDMSVVMSELPDRSALEQACQRGGRPALVLDAGRPRGHAAAGGGLHGRRRGGADRLCHAPGAGTADRRTAAAPQPRHTPLHKLAEGILKAEPLFGNRPLQALQARLAEFPPALAEAMARHFSATPHALESHRPDRAPRRGPVEPRPARAGLLPVAGPCWRR